MRRSLLFLLLAVGLLTTLPSVASASATYFTTAQILREFFPSSEKVTYRKVQLTPAQAESLRARLGYKPAKSEYVIFVAMTGEKVDGYAVIDDERGQHEPITFGVKLSPEGKVERQEVMVYREKYGEEITDPRFRAQFVGKGPKDPIRAGRDVDVISGATISSRSMAVGVRRAVALVDELVLHPAKPAEG
ncbi:FMN-binding protein [Vulgatibacter incomptus]|uniref:Putative signal peptide protein n=1 Tax=Vulgatibacter incomptus TaxID=1391653 RepID=A0A0K1PC30_9BACT|nr:FMN-binding protein [Vulgatibacter incomptus]AKU91085.1 putative signal peptide protein [Vulgatibacter incomptus]